MANEFVTISIKQSKEEEIKNYYAPFKVINNGEYIDAMFKKDDLVITIYSGKKENKKITFAGNGALNEALLWDKEAQIKETKEKQKQAWEFFGSQIGSDEVGVGDFLGPMIVVAAFVRPSDIKDLKLYGVDDSKRLKDEDILAMGPALAKRFFFSKLTLSNEKYNEMIDKGENLNSLKAKMHDKYLMSPDSGLGLDRLQVLSWYTLYQCIMMLVMLLALWLPSRGRTTPFQWRWSIPFISLFLCAADYAYLQALSQPGALIAVISMIRRGSVLVSFLIGAFFLKERNIKAKAFDLLLLLLSMIFLYLGSR